MISLLHLSDRLNQKLMGVKGKSGFIDTIILILTSKSEIWSLKSNLVGFWKKGNFSWTLLSMYAKIEMGIF